MRLADVRALKSQIAEVMAHVIQEGSEPKCVVVTDEQKRALLMLEGSDALSLAGCRVLVLSDVAVGSPLPDGLFQVLDRVPEVSQC